jgi:hypothetical protein
LTAQPPGLTLKPSHAHTPTAAASRMLRADLEANPAKTRDDAVLALEQDKR